MASSHFVYTLQPLLTAVAARESALRLRHAQAASAMAAGVRELVALDRAAGRLAAALGWSVRANAASPAWQAGEIDRRLARLEAVRTVRIAEIDAARQRVAETREELATVVRRRKALERHRARRLERHRLALEAAEEAEREEAATLQRGSPLDRCEVLSA
jgi:hypothetical protein